MKAANSNFRGLAIEFSYTRRLVGPLPLGPVGAERRGRETSEDHAAHGVSGG